MNKIFSVLNPLQLLVAIIGVIVFLMLPVVSFGILGITLLGIDGLTLLRLNYLVFLLPLLLLIVMAVCSMSSLRIVSIVVGALCCLATLITSLMASDILLSNITPLLAFIPADVMEKANLSIDTASFVLKNLVQPGLGSIINITLSVVYCLLAFVTGGVSGGSSTGVYNNGGNPQDRGNSAAPGVYNKNIKL